MSNIFIGLKKTCLGVLDRGERDKDHEIALKEGGGIEMSTTVLPLRDALLRLNTHRKNVFFRDSNNNCWISLFNRFGGGVANILHVFNMRVKWYPWLTTKLW